MGAYPHGAKIQIKGGGVLQSPLKLGRQKNLESGMDFFILCLNLGPKIKDYTQKMTYHLKGKGLSFYLQKIGLIGPKITKLWPFLYGNKDIP